MLFFVNDYGEGAHEAILAHLAETNREHLMGYGSDPYTARAKEKILAAAGCPGGDVFFISGGTQTNETVISAYLRSYEGAVACSTGHIACHEAGAIEHSGHKVLTIPGHAGKMVPAGLEAYLAAYYADGNHEHMVFTGLVYISYPTEYGTLYTKEELTEISRIAHAYHLPLYVDGARLGYGLMSPASDITLPELSALCDVFYIGGTKCGALCGEAVVFSGMHAPAHPIPRIKQHGALLAKGRLTGVQFESLFADGLYFEIGRQAIETAQALRRVLHERGYQFFLETPTNQQFVILPNEDMARIREHASIEYWEKYDETHTVVRFCTSWATTQEDIDALAAVL